MSKAAQHQSIRRDDFVKILPVDKNAVFHAPHLPSLHDGGADDPADDDHDESVKLQPINIQVLKELMQKKVQRAPQRPGQHKNSTQMGASGSVSGMRSRQSSNVSLRSNPSNKSLKSSDVN